MNGRYLAGAVAGGLAAGLGITALMMAGERRSGRPSELIALERASAARIGVPAPMTHLPTAGEQALAQGGHLLLSALAGVAYAGLVDEEADAVPAGLLFGLGFYGLAHWLAGPALGVKPPEWRSPPATIAMHMMNHMLFGLVTALSARRAASA